MQTEQKKGLPRQKQGHVFGTVNSCVYGTLSEFVSQAQYLLFQGRRIWICVIQAGQSPPLRYSRNLLLMTYR